jgi:hypothetical protein
MNTDLRGSAKANHESVIGQENQEGSKDAKS